MSKLILLINLFCNSEIDPKYDELKCIDFMYVCTVHERVSIDDCADYYDTDFKYTTERQDAMYYNWGQ